MTTSAETSTLTAFDSEGEIAAEVVLWIDAESLVRLDAVWPDGLYLSVLTDGETATIESDDMPEVAERVIVLQTALASWEDVSRDEWIRCGGSALVAAGGCATAVGGWGIVVCAGATTIAAANCVDVLEGLLE